MLRVMDMSTGKIIEEEFGSFEDQVLNAEWLPQPALELGLQPVVSRHDAVQPVQDAEAFLRSIYLSQE
jgi:hypothetical protein